MLGPPQIARLSAIFPALAADRRLTGQMGACASAVALQAGRTICHPGDVCSHLALVLSGSARIFKLAESGREITLYRVDSGECCILTASCMLSGREFPATATVEQPLQAVVVPAARVVAWMAEYAAWRQFLWNLLAERLGDVIGLVEEVAFRRMDERLLDHLAGHASLHGNELQATHSRIAADLGTSREVVSRMLKDLEQRGVVQLHRGRIEILDVAALTIRPSQCD